MVFFHGNSEDIIQSFVLYKNLSIYLNLHILVVEYPGYGIYKGNPTSELVEKDAIDVYDYLTKNMKISE